MLCVKEAARNGGRGEFAPYRLRVINAYSDVVRYVRSDIHTKFVIPMASIRIEAMILIVHLKLRELLARW